MKKLLLVIMVVAVVFSASHVKVFSQDTVMYGFEKNAQGWEIPDWSLDKDDYGLQVISLNEEVAKEGTSSLKLHVDFIPEEWNAGIVEVEEYFDLTNSNKLSCDLYIPKDAPRDMEARITLTVGDDFYWIQMTETIALYPGRWITLTANLRNNNSNWRHNDDIVRLTEERKANVRKIGVRVESDGIQYKGAIYIDNVRAYK